MNKSKIMILKKAAALLVLLIIVSIAINLNYQEGARRAKKGLEASSTLATMLIRSKAPPINEEELIITAMTLFGSAKHPGESYLDNDIQAQLAVLDSAKNRAAVCGTSFTNELLKFGFSSDRNKYSAMYSVWENGGPKIGYADIERFSKALAQARKVILTSRDTLPDKRITHYHQSRMKSPPKWSKTFLLIKKAGGNSFYQEKGENGAYCKATVPKAIPIPVKNKPGKKKVKAKSKKGRKMDVAVADLLARIRGNYQKEALNVTGESL